jgi:hypothetical protein
MKKRNQCTFWGAVEAVTMYANGNTYEGKRVRRSLIRRRRQKSK